MHDNGQTDGLETRTLTHTRPSITDGLPTGQLAGRRGGEGEGAFSGIVKVHSYTW